MPYPDRKEQALPISRDEKDPPTFRFPEYGSPKVGGCFKRGTFPMYYFCRR